VAEEDARERVGDDERDARSADRDGCDLARGAASEVGPADQYVALGHAAGPRLASRNTFHGVLAELLLVERVDGVLGRGDLASVAVGPELPSASPNHFRESHRISAGIFASTSDG